MRYLNIYINTRSPKLHWKRIWKLHTMCTSSLYFYRVPRHGCLLQLSLKHLRLSIRNFCRQTLHNILSKTILLQQDAYSTLDNIAWGESVWNGPLACMPDCNRMPIKGWKASKCAVTAVQVDADPYRLKRLEALSNSTKHAWRQRTPRLGCSSPQQHCFRQDGEKRIPYSKNAKKV